MIFIKYYLNKNHFHKNMGRILETGFTKKTQIAIFFIYLSTGIHIKNTGFTRSITRINPKI